MQTNMVKVKCSHCGRKFDGRIYPTIRIDEDPSYKRKVLSTSVFIQKCPYCHQDMVFPYACFYDDPKARLLVGMVPEDKIVDEYRMYNNLPDYQIRRVSQPIEMVEKIELRDCHYQDTLMECMKFHLLEYLNNQGIPAAKLIFHIVQGKKRMIVIQKDGSTGSIAFEQQWYQEAVETYRDIAEERSRHVYVIDDAWARNVLHPIKLEESAEGVSIQ